MAFGVEDRVVITFFGIADGPAAAERTSGWVLSETRGVEHLGTGVQLGGENLANRPARFMTDEGRRRLDDLRDRWDPERLFCPLAVATT